MNSNVVQELKETKSIRNKLLASSIERRQKSNTLRIPEDVKIERKNEERAYSLIKKLVTKDIKEELVELDTIVEEYTNRIYEATGWWMIGREGFMYQDNFQNMQDPEFKSFDTYRIYRNEEGFYVSDKESFNSYFEGIKRKEQDFLEKNQEELLVIHEALTSKEQLLSSFIPLKNEEKRDLVNELINYLGYKSEEQLKEKSYC